MNLQWKSIKKRERLATRGRVLGVKWMKTVFADVKLWVLGRSEPLPLVLQSMMSGITCQLITKTGRAFFYTLFTYKEAPSSFIPTIL